jgi:hypothetical protein
MAIALIVTWWRIPPAVPVVESVVQLTDDGQPKSEFFTDGLRLYFTEGPPSRRKIVQASVTGGPATTVETGFVDAIVQDLARDGSGLLVRVPNGGAAGDVGTLWWVPLPAGEPRHLGNFTTIESAMLSDGRIVFNKSILERIRA